MLPGGLPYIQRDGRRVPGTRMYEAESDRYDRTRLQRLFDDTTALALAARLTGRGDFAAHAARLIETWFVAPETRMTPHLRYAQVRRGWNRNEGVGTGIIELKDLHYFLDAVRLLERGCGLAPRIGAGLDAWLAAYLGWLTASRQGGHERRATNNHGTYYDLQVAAVAARLGMRDTVRETLVRAQGRIAAQITAAGAQPEEAARRTRAHYCTFNLQGWTALMRIGRRTGVLDPDPAAEPWNRVAAAVARVADDARAGWPGGGAGGFDPARLVPLLAHAREAGIAADPAPGPAPPRFDPHDGIPPYWPLTGAP